MTLFPESLNFQITPQPDDDTCGPSCLHSVYRHYKDEVPLDQVIDEVHLFETGGTIAVFLALHAIQRGYRATIYTCNLHMFDPTWFVPGAPNLADRLRAQAAAKPEAKLQLATDAYLEYLECGGRVLMEDITVKLLRELLDRGCPLIAGLSATWLYRAMRERTTDFEDDDAAGEPMGHFVIAYGLDESRRKIKIADPYIQAPFPNPHQYEVDVDRFIGAVLLGIVTYDAKLLVIEPADDKGT